MASFIEIDVLGITLKAQHPDRVNDGDLRYGFRQLNSDHIVAMDPHEPNVRTGQFRGANARITLVTGEVFHTPRTLDEIHKLRKEATASGDLATCFNKKAVPLPSPAMSEYFKMKEGFQRHGVMSNGVPYAEVKDMRLVW